MGKICKQSSIEERTMIQAQSAMGQQPGQIKNSQHKRKFIVEEKAWLMLECAPLRNRPK